MFWQKPKCSLEVRQGSRGAWRWTARSVGNQTVNGVPITDRQVIAVDTVQGGPDGVRDEGHRPGRYARLEGS